VPPKDPVKASDVGRKTERDWIATLSHSEPRPGAGLVYADRDVIGKVISYCNGVSTWR
jgi:hypothetical protein